MSNQPGKYAYNLKLWHPTILGRLDAFLAALAAHIDQHPNLTQISTTESAIGEPVTSFVEEGECAEAVRWTTCGDSRHEEILCAE